MFIRRDLPANLDSAYPCAELYSLYNSAHMTTKGIETARKELPALVEQAHRGEVTIITKRGIPYAALVPLSAVPQKQAKLTLTQLRGSGRKVWREDAGLAVERLRGEWA